METYEQISTAQHKVLERLTELNAITSYNRACLALVVLGVKPACGLAFGEDSLSNKEEFLSLRAEVEALLGKLKLPYTMSVEQYGDITGVSYAVGKNISALEAAKSAEGHIAFGIAMGFPETSARAFQKQWEGQSAMLSDVEVPSDLAHNEAYKCRFFGFSQDHWRDELPVAEKWAKVLRIHAPNLYRAILEENS